MQAAMYKWKPSRPTRLQFVARQASFRLILGDETLPHQIEVMAFLSGGGRLLTIEQLPGSLRFRIVAFAK